MDLVTREQLEGNDWRWEGEERDGLPSNIEGRRESFPPGQASAGLDAFIRTQLGTVPGLELAAGSSVNAAGREWLRYDCTLSLVQFGEQRKGVLVLVTPSYGGFVRVVMHVASLEPSPARERLIRAMLAGPGRDDAYSAEEIAALGELPAPPSTMFTPGAGPPPGKPGMIDQAIADYEASVARGAELAAQAAKEQEESERKLREEAQAVMNYIFGGENQPATAALPGELERTAEPRDVAVPGCLQLLRFPGNGSLRVAERNGVRAEDLRGSVAVWQLEPEARVPGGPSLIIVRAYEGGAGLYVGDMAAWDMAFREPGSEIAQRLVEAQVALDFNGHVWNVYELERSGEQAGETYFIANGQMGMDSLSVYFYAADPLDRGLMAAQIGQTLGGGKF